MKLNESTIKVEREGVQQERSFGIKFSAKAAHILSNALYSNKIGAVVRELSANAYDAHIQAGKPTVPFHITLPSQWSNSFEVKDEGPGLDEDDVLTLYTTYFESTKANSNDQTGAFGLGSKSPFAYTDAFTVTSCHGGMKKTYSAFKNEEGMFSMAKLSEVPTNETGLHVKVPVRPSDTYRFLEEAKNQLEFFEPRPTIGGQKIDFPVRTVVKEGPQWKVFKTGGWNTLSRRVRMGCIAYPLDLNLLDSSCSNLFHNMSVLFEVKMGDIDLTPSREGIDYNPRTKKFLSALVSRADEEFFKDIEDKFKAASSLWEATMLWNDLYGYGGPLYEHQGRPVFYKGQQLKNNVSWRPPAKKFDPFGKELPGQRTWDVEFRSLSVSYLDRKHKSIQDFWASSIAVIPTLGVEIYIVDTPHYYPEISYKHSQKPFIDNVYLVKGAQADIDDVLNALGWPKANIHRTSDIQIPKSAKVALTRTAKVLEWKGFKWDSTNLDYGTNTGYFLYLYKGSLFDKPKADGGQPVSTSMHSLVPIVNFYKAEKRIDVKAFYGIPGTYHEQFKRASGWIDLRAELSRLINEDAQKAGLSDVLAEYLVNLNFITNNPSKVETLRTLAKLNANIGAKVSNFLMLYDNAKKSLNTTESAIVSRAQEAGIEILPTKPVTINLQKEYAALSPTIRDLANAFVAYYNLDKDPWRTVVSMIQP